MEYQVRFIGEMDKRQRELVIEAARHGQDILAAFDRMMPRLRQDPFSQGEALYHLSNGAPAHHYVESPLSMWFVIQAAFRVVWVYRLDCLLASDK